MGYQRRTLATRRGVYKGWKLHTRVSDDRWGLVEKRRTKSSRERRKGKLKRCFVLSIGGRRRERGVRLGDERCGREKGGEERLWCGESDESFEGGVSTGSVFSFRERLSFSRQSTPFQPPHWPRMARSQPLPKVSRIDARQKSATQVRFCRRRQSVFRAQRRAVNKRPDPDPKSRIIHRVIHTSSQEFYAVHIERCARSRKNGGGKKKRTTT